MGFYLDLRPAPAFGNTYREMAIPPIFWALYGFLGFALACMGSAAYALLGDLLFLGSIWDRLLVGIISLSLPVYLLIGVRLLWIKWFVRWEEEVLYVGYQFKGKPFLYRRIKKDRILGVILANVNRGENLAKLEHEDSQYYLRGHWRVILNLKDRSKPIVLDKHTDREALIPMWEAIKKWLG